MTFAEHVNQFNANLNLDLEMPEGIRVMNPFRENPHALATSQIFYEKYYSDQQTRQLILGINPGRHGAGVTGIPFTDTKRLEEFCELPFPGGSTHEPSSVWVYRAIEAYGGPTKFYQNIYINSICPLGFVITNKHGREVNYNYYDSKELTQIVEPFIKWNIRTQLEFGIDRKRCYCWGMGKNYKYLKKLNEQEQWFAEIVPLPHPRYIIQYKSKQSEKYVAEFLESIAG